MNRRTDGDIKFGLVMGIAPGREGDVYDILVDKAGSYQSGKTADGIYKVILICACVCVCVFVCVCVYIYIYVYIYVVFVCICMYI